jgi:two-component system, NtrC family, sensor kinase
LLNNPSFEHKFYFRRALSQYFKPSIVGNFPGNYIYFPKLYNTAGKGLLFAFFNIFLCLCYPVVSFSQNSFGKELIALEQAFSSETIKEKPYIDARNELLEKYVNVYPDSVISAGEKTKSLSRKFNYQQGEAQALLIQGIAFSNKRLYDKSEENLEKAYVIAKNIKSKKMESRILNNLGSVYIDLGNYPLAFEKFFEALKQAEMSNDKEMIGALLNNIANIYFFQDKFEEAENYYHKTLDLSVELKDTPSIAITYNNLGEVNMAQKDYTNAIRYLQKAIEMGAVVKNKELKLASVLTLAKTYEGLDSIPMAIQLYESAIDEAHKYGDALYEARGLISMGHILLKQGRGNEALEYTEKGIELAKKIGNKSLIRDGHELLAGLYEKKGDYKQALSNQQFFKLYADSLNNFESERSAALQQASYEYSKKELQFQRQALQQRWLIFSSLAGFITLGIIAFLINKTRSRLNKANFALNARNLKIEQQKEELEETLSKLTNTQTQLIQAEKMASLGELTAGIAHEIQNPLNFVTNFSEVSADLIEEMIEELQKGNQEEAFAITEDLKDNLKRIEQHGKRADSIVKSMLSHSRKSTGNKEPTDLNKLCNEYLKLAFNGIRSHDKSFNAKLNSVFAPDVGMIELSPQEIGRVLLNLFNNAFYAVSKREDTGEEGYVPMVKLETKKVGNLVYIVIEDNGMGIPEDNLTKIFQPFFTTKPSGVGTGLGLSISYDIITKGHGGQMEVESRLNEYTRFIISLPIV